MKKLISAITIGLLAVILSGVLYWYWPLLVDTNNSDKTDSIYPQYTVPYSVMETGKYPDTPREVLEEYLRLDAEGGYLSDQGLNYLRTLSPTNSGMRDKMIVMMIIKEYRILSIEQRAEKIVARVEYDELGELEHGSWFVPWTFRKNRRKNLINYVLERKNGRWILGPDMLYSSISKRTAEKYIRMSVSEKSTPPGMVKHANKLIQEINLSMK